MKKFFLSIMLGVFAVSFLQSQIKIGNNPQNIDGSSVLELESNNRVLVITRISEAQMNSITPLQGGLVYNTDEECVFYFNGSTWVNLCEELNTFNVDFGIVDEDLVLTDNNGDSVSVPLSDLGVSTFTNAPVFNPEDNDNTIVITETGDNVNIEVGEITGFNIVDSSINGFLDIQDGSIVSSKLQDDSVDRTKIDANVAGVGLTQAPDGSLDVDVTEFTGTGTLSSPTNTLTISGDPANALFNSVGLDVADDAITFEKMADNAIGTLEIRNDAVTNAKILDASITNNKLDKPTIPISGFAPGAADVDFGNNLLRGVVDPVLPNDAANRNYVDNQISVFADDDITDVTFDGANLTVEEGATNFSADLSALEESADITANATALAAHIAADTDTDETNELSDLQIAGTTISLTNAATGAIGVDLDATFATNAQVAAAADDDITDVTFDGTNLTVEEGATNFSADLSALEESADITANATALAAHIAADTDTDETNELSDLQIAGTTISLTNAAAGAVGVDLDATFATNAQLTAATDDDITDVTFDGTNITVEEGTTSFSADLSDLEESADITANATALAAHIAADTDTDETNEIQTLASSDGSLNITLTGINYDVSIASISGGVSGVIATNSITQGDIANGAIGPGEIQSNAVSGDEIQNESIENADISLTAAIEGTKINPNFGTLNVTTTGDVTANSFISATTTYPDYVFQKYFLGKSELNSDYDFKSLKNVETYLKKNHHLPGITSAYEVHANGGKWNLTEGALKNLEKIEELFLHTIEQEKKIENLTSKNEVLAKELDALRKDLDETKALLRKQ